LALQRAWSDIAGDGADFGLISSNGTGRGLRGRESDLRPSGLTFWLGGGGRRPTYQQKQHAKFPNRPNPQQIATLATNDNSRFFPT
jgi:hypothetical protein